ncbi:MAG: PLP-dependent aminotransferase family protein [Solirubrobacterales bacterium]|nr:PLP-dependent aminotransferase family protein [Solirubrobacterales bacterium]
MDLLVEFEQGAPLHLQLERQLRDAIRVGRLRPGVQLPASRVLAGELGVSRGVVVEAYSQLTAEGYLVARRGAGTVVAEGPMLGERSAGGEPTVAPRVVYDLRPGQPDYASFPRQRLLSAFARAMRQLPDNAFSYGDPCGIGELRSAVSEYVGRVRAAVAAPENVVVSSGLAHGLTNVWLALRDRGAKRVGVEDPGWRWQVRTAERAGLTAVPVPVDERGLVVEELERLDLDAVTVTPAHHFPTGVVMSAERRSALLDWARRRDALILEDDYDAEYRYDRDPVAALQGMAPDHVAFCATTSKMLAPALRLAWIVLPERYVSDVARQYVVTWASPSTIEQAAMANFLRGGELDRHMRRTRRIYRRRRDALVRALGEYLPQLRIGGAAAGLHLVAWLPEGADEPAIAGAARRRGVAVHAIHRHCTCVAPIPPALILGYAQCNELALRRAVQELCEVMS